jgi:predicted transposase YbfD/YdcC
MASRHGLTLGQVAVDCKSNEITAIPQLLEMMDLKGTIVTLDAMGCQKSIAKKIIDGNGDYTLAVKNNHPKLFTAIENAFIEAHENGLVESGVRSVSTDHKQASRLEERHYAVGPIPKEMKSLTAEWAGAKSIGQAIKISEKNGKATSEVRYYISSRPAKVSEFSDSIRSHWSIEAMHWVLDVVFHEDASRIRMGNGTENMSFVRRFVTTLLKQDTTKVSLKQKRKKAGWNTDFLEKLLLGARF